MKNTAFLLVISFMVFAFACNNKEQKEFEKKYMEEISKDEDHVELFNTLERFEAYLLENDYLAKANKEEYKQLLDQVVKDEVVLEMDSLFFKQVNGDLIGSPNNMGFLLNSIPVAYEKWYGAKDPSNTAYNMSLALKKIRQNGSLNNPELNQALFNAVPEKDFEKRVYRAPFIAIIYKLLDFNYSRYHHWKTLNSIQFKPNTTEIDLEKTDMTALDSLAMRLNPSNPTIYAFLVIAFHEDGDRANIQLSKERTEALINYLVKEKNANERQVKAFTVRENDTKYLNTLYKKRKASVLYYERYF